MVNETFEEVSAILKHIMENPSVPRNIRRAADESFNTLNDDSEDPTVRASAVILKLDEISNDPRILAENLRPVLLCRIESTDEKAVLLHFRIGFTQIIV